MVRVSLLLTLILLSSGCRSSRMFVTADGRVPVGVGEGNVFSSISKAVQAAEEKDTIYVFEGTYRDHIKLKPGQVLIGDSTFPTIDGFGSGSVITAADDCTIKNLTIKGGGKRSGIEDCGVYILNSKNVVVGNNRIIENGHYGIIVNSGTVLVRDNVISKNNILGIYITGSSVVDIVYNTISSHKVHGVDIVTSLSTVTIDSNVISDNETGIVYGNNFSPSLNIDIINTLFRNNDEAISMSAKQIRTLQGCTFSDNQKDWWDWSTGKLVDIPAGNRMAK